MVRIHPHPPTREWRNWQTRTVQVRVGSHPCRFKSCFPHHIGASFVSLAPIFLQKSERAHAAAPPFGKKSRSAHLLGCKRPRDGSLSLTTFAGSSPHQNFAVASFCYLLTYWLDGFDARPSCFFCKNARGTRIFDTSALWVGFIVGIEGLIITYGTAALQPLFSCAETFYRGTVSAWS